jgi:hypothetical protein
MGRPIYSDDRWVREFARAMDVSAFGTLAVIDALHADELLDSQRRTQARLALAARGGWGVCLTGSELRTAAEESKWTLNASLIGGLRDRAAWRGDPAETFSKLAEFLDAVCKNRPDALGTWVARVVDAGHTAIPHMSPSWFAESLLLMAWGLDPASRKSSDACFQALVDGIKNLPVWLTTLGHDPVLGAMNQILMQFADQALPSVSRSSHGSSADCGSRIRSGPCKRSSICSSGFVNVTVARARCNAVVPQPDHLDQLAAWLGGVPAHDRQRPPGSEPLPQCAGATIRRGQR